MHAVHGTVRIVRSPGLRGLYAGSRRGVDRPRRPAVDRRRSPCGMAVDPDPAKVIGLVAREHDHSRRSMQIRVLGPLEASIDDQPVAIGGAKQRAVLAMLGLEANRAVTGGPADRGPVGRRAAGQRRQDGAELRLAAAQRAGRRGRGGDRHARARRTSCGSTASWSTSCRLERLVSEASRAAAARRPASAAREALALFRGEPLADVADEPFADAGDPPARGAAARRAELAIDADLAAGRHRELVGEIEALRGREPAARAAARAAHARAVPLRPPGRGARGLPARPADAGRGDRRRAVRRAAATCTRRSCARTRRWTSRPPPTSSRASSTRPRRRR